MASPVVSPLAPTSEPHKWRWVSSIDVRQGDHPAVPAPLPGMLEGRVTLIAGAGGSGKTTLTEQLVRHLCNGWRLGKFDVPDELMIGWCLFLEDVEAMAQDRSLRAAWLGALEEDEKSQRWDSPVRYLFGRDFSMHNLRQELAEARFLQVLPGVVVIDHFRLLIGPQPAGTSPNDWERKRLRDLVDLADEFETHFVVLTHLNKAGKISGTTEMINSVDTAYVLEPSPEDRELATLVCAKMRMSPETDFALKKGRNGTWEFTDQALVSEAQAMGIARDIVRVLKREGPRTLSQLITHPTIEAGREAIRKALYRSKLRGWVRPYRGHWELTPSAGDDLLAAPEPEPPPAAAPAAIPRDHASNEGRNLEPVRDIPGQRADSAAADEDQDVWDPEPEPEDHGFPGLAHLKESFNRSRMHPLPCVPKEQRDQLPWSLFTNRIGGEPHNSKRKRFEQPQPMGGQLLRIDRNGSFPSACSSVRVAPNKLLHTGPLDEYDSTKAGIYLITRPEWREKTMPHPLGRIVEHGDGPVWVTTQHLVLLLKLAQKGRVPVPQILDSWTGRANGSLFEHYYKEARAARAELAGDPEQAEAYLAYKKRVSTSLRLLWPKTAHSPFWRPDWRSAVVAEAAVRHWVQADAAVQAGGGNVILVRFSNVDEAWFWTPDGRLPAPYRPGLGFGEVKLKPLTADEGDED